MVSLLMAHIANSICVANWIMALISRDSKVRTPDLLCISSLADAAKVGFCGRIAASDVANEGLQRAASDGRNPYNTSKACCTASGRSEP